MSNIASRWRALSGEEDWEGLLDPLDLDLRRLIIHYGEMVQAISDAFIETTSLSTMDFLALCKEALVLPGGLRKEQSICYQVTKYFYATKNIISSVEDGFIKRSRAVDPTAGDSNWIGYIAVATDTGTTVLGRRDILICWRGTEGLLEGIIDAVAVLTSVEILGKEHDPKVHLGWYSMYTMAHEDSPFNSTSCREQVLSEVKRLVDHYKDEEVSITMVGYSLGAAMATLNAVDIVYNGINLKPSSNISEPINACLVTAFGFGVRHYKNLGL